jgi:5-formyltetrahydrofolate cyclo-ligase
MQTPPVAAKATLRKAMRERRMAMSDNEWAGASARICSLLLAQPALQVARRVGLFAPLLARREVDVRPLADMLSARGIELFYPVITNPPNAACTGDFRRVTRDSEWVTGAFGVLEPSANCPAAARGDIDVIVVPCLAVTINHERLGYGSGFYDRVLPNLCPPATTVVVGFAFQLVDSLPTTPHDFRCDAVVTA